MAREIDQVEQRRLTTSTQGKLPGNYTPLPLRGRGVYTSYSVHFLHVQILRTSASTIAAASTATPKRRVQHRQRQQHARQH
jgi:cbb3-type cytochrome oxidase cytochrome c subunit